MNKKRFAPGKDVVLYAKPSFGEKEISAVAECLRKGWLGVGSYTEEFERKVAEIFGQEFGVFVNSGSSANLLAIRSLDLPAGGEIITPACTFSTTLNPILESGFMPVFVDVEEGTYNVNPRLVEAAITSKTVALMIPHLIGNINDMPWLRRIADTHGLRLIEDSCDTIGSTIHGRPTGFYADASTTSFYATHIITAMGMGGMVMFKAGTHAEKARILRDWGRAAAQPFDEHPDVRFGHYLDGIQYDGKFVFCERGFNFKANDPLAAFGLVQLERLHEFAKIRKGNFSQMYNFFFRFREHFILPAWIPGADVRWLAFPLTIRETSPLKRTDLMLHLEKHKIQTRTIFSGNILRHPPYRNIPHRTAGALVYSDAIMVRGLLLGCHHELTKEHLEYVMQVVGDYLEKV